MVKVTPIVTDFDGTIYKHKFPDIGEPMPGVKAALETLKKRGFELSFTPAERHPIGKTSSPAIR